MSLGDNLSTTMGEDDIPVAEETVSAVWSTGCGPDAGGALQLQSEWCPSINTVFLKSLRCETAGQGCGLVGEGRGFVEEHVTG